MTQQFRSRIGGPFVLAAAIVVGLGGTATVNAIMTGSILKAGIYALPIALLVWMFISTRYTVTDTDLRIRCAFLRASIPLASIRRLRTTRNAISAPALSLDRIEITHDAGIALVSPRDRSAFARAILARAPSVDVQGM